MKGCQVADVVARVPYSVLVLGTPLTNTSLVQGIQLIFCVIILTLVPILPESPRWLLARRREADAKHVLGMLNDDVDVEEEFEAIRSSVKAEQAAQTSWAQLLKGGLATRRVLLGMMLQVAQQ